MTKEFILQYVHACQGYKRFFFAWCRIGNDPNQCPTESEWEMFVDDRRRGEDVQPPLAELVEIFPDIIKTAKKKMLELKELYEITEKECDATLDQLLLAAQTTDKVLMMHIKDISYEPLENVREDMKKWERIIRIDEWKRKPPDDTTITDIDIARAKEIPLTGFVKVNHAGFVPCPFHKEKTPSCKIFKDNRFHCFGCSADGDVIDWIMKENNIEFIPAVKKILGK